MVLGETDKTAVNIQARPFMARTLEINGKACQAEGKAKVVARGIWSSFGLTTVGKAI